MKNILSRFVFPSSYLFVYSEEILTRVQIFCFLFFSFFFLNVNIIYYYYAHRVFIAMICLMLIYVIPYTRSLILPLLKR